MELEHGPDYDNGKKKVKNYKQIASSDLKKKKVMLVFEDETIVTQKPPIIPLPLLSIYHYHLDRILAPL